jgi:aldose 1-epimerase
MIEKSIVGRLDGREVAAFTLTNARGTRVKVLELGCRIAELHLAGRDGRAADIVLGYDDLSAHAADTSYFGAVCGRYANRIAGGRFALDGAVYRVTRNEGANHLHGGTVGFDRKLWAGKVDASRRSIAFAYRSPDGEEGFPGRLDAKLSLSLDDEDRLAIEMTGETDRPTICNLAHHGYWNLAGHDSGDVLGQKLTLDAPFYTPVDAALVPTGEILSVAGTGFDFTTGKEIGRDSRGEFDFNAVLAGEAGRLRRAARAFDPVSDRGFELWTDQPGVQLYTGLHLGPAILGKGGHPYCRQAGFALETQHFPNSPNHAHFPSCRLDPGETYRHRMEFRFFVSAS